MPVTIEKPKLNIYQKLQKSRVDLQKTELKKTGVNKYSNYTYFELGDFLPAINEICNNNKLSTIFHYGDNKATLTIVDVDNIVSKLEFETPIEIATLKGCSSIQNIGGTQTYARRYLYIMAFEIAESDTIDGGEIDQEAELGKQKINKASVITIKNLITETESDYKQFLSWAGVESVEDITNASLVTCINMLNKKKKDYEEKMKKKEAIRQQQEHQKELEAKQENFEF